MRERAEERHIGLSVSGENLMVDGVRNFLYEMFYNLIDNAIKYNIDGGKVEVTVLTGDTAATVSVKDTGIGIPRSIRREYLNGFSEWIKAAPRLPVAPGWGCRLSSISRSIITQKSNCIAGMDAGPLLRFCSP